MGIDWTAAAVIFGLILAIVVLKELEDRVAAALLLAVVTPFVLLVHWLRLRRTRQRNP